MAKRGGFPGGGMPGSMNNLMKQAQKMQKQMEEATKELEEKEVTGKAGGGAEWYRLFPQARRMGGRIPETMVATAWKILCKACNDRWKMLGRGGNYGR